MEAPAPKADGRAWYGKHPSQFVDFWMARTTPSPLAINIHGGFWRARFDLTHAGHLCAALVTAGFAVINIEYRRVGQEGGGWPGTVEDVRRAVAYARERAPFCGGRAGDTIVLGHSAGGHLALCIAAETQDLRGVFALAPVSDPRRAWQLNLGNGAATEFFGGTPDEFPDRYTMHPPVCPTVLIHGTADDVVPVELSRGFTGARLVELPGADHFDVIDPQSGPFAEVLSQLLPR